MLLEETLASASPDLLREMIQGFVQRLMDAEVDQRCRAEEAAAGVIADSERAHCHCAARAAGNWRRDRMASLR